MFLQDELNEATNTGWDQVNLALQKIIAVNKDRVPTGLWERLVSKPSAIWQFENIDDIRKAFQVIDFPPLLRDFYMRIDMIMRAIQEVTAANKATVGVGGAEEEAGGGTATGQMMNKQASSERFMLYARTIESSGLSDAQRKFYHRIFQFKSYESASEILGPEGAQDFDFIPPQILESVAKLMPKGVMSYEAKGVKVRVMMEFFRMFQQYPWFKSYESAREIIDAAENIDPDKMVFSDEEMQQFMQMRQQLQQQTGIMGLGAGQGGAPGGGPQRPSGGPPQRPGGGQIPSKAVSNRVGRVSIPPNAQGA